MDVHHISKLIDCGMFAYQHTDFLDDIGGVGAIGMAA